MWLLHALDTRHGTGPLPDELIERLDRLEVEVRSTMTGEEQTAALRRLERVRSR